MRSIEITLTNREFFISPNTGKALIRRLRKVLPDLRKQYGDGRLGNARILYLKASINKGDMEEINRICSNFTSRYEYLFIKAVLRK